MQTDASGWRPPTSPPPGTPDDGDRTIMMPGPGARPPMASQPPVGTGTHRTGSMPAITGPPPPHRPPLHSAPPGFGMPPGMVQPAGGPVWGPPQGSFGPPPQLAVLQPPPIRLHGKPDPRLVMLTDPDSARAVGFRLLRDNLLAQRLPRVIAVTSSLKGDGKTTCATNLAYALAEAAHVLLLEGSFLEPALATLFCIDDAFPVLQNVPWLAPYRIGEVSRTLHVAAPLGRGASAPARFDKAWYEQLIGNFRRFNYEHIVIDAAALSASPTVSQLVSISDGALLAVRSGVTTARALRRAAEQIPPGKAIGVALIDTKPTH